MRSASGSLRMRDEENESEEGAVEDDYGSGEISKREERRCREKRTNADESRERESLSEYMREKV